MSAPVGLGGRTTKVHMTARIRTRGRDPWAVSAPRQSLRHAAWDRECRRRGYRLLSAASGIFGLAVAAFCLLYFAGQLLRLASPGLGL